VETLDEAPRDLAAAPAIGRRRGPEAVEAHVTVAETLQCVLAAQHGGEQAVGTWRAPVVGCPSRINRRCAAS